jgi:hypothetical protein
MSIGTTNARLAFFSPGFLRNSCLANLPIPLPVPVPLPLPLPLPVPVPDLNLDLDLDLNLNLALKAPTAFVSRRCAPRTRP